MENNVHHLIIEKLREFGFGIHQIRAFCTEFLHTQPKAVSFVNNNPEEHDNFAVLFDDGSIWSYDDWRDVPWKRIANSPFNGDQLP